MKKLLLMAAFVLLPAFTEAQIEPVRRNNTTQGNSSGSNSSSRRNNNRSNNNRSSSNDNNRSGNQNQQRHQQQQQQRHQQQQQQGSVQQNNNAGASQPVATTLCPDGHHPHAIDLGLPSGTKWACCNVGASKPEDYGDYFAWGETQTKSNYDWSTYSWCNGSSTTLTKYNNNSSNGTVDNKTQLELSDDAACALRGGSWRMPTIAELRELKDNCTFSWTTVNGVKGAKFTSRNGRSVFLPAAGNRWYSGLDYAGSYGYYWSSTLYESGPYDAYYLSFYSGNAGWNGSRRSNGRSVRPVLRN